MLSDTRAEGCIFVDTPKECIFWVDNFCTSPPSHQIRCLFNHRRLIVNEDSIDVLQRVFLKVIRSPKRVKTVSGQGGRGG